MKYKILSMLLCLCFFAAGHGWAAPAFEPKDCPKDLKYILGMYYGNGEMFLLRENTEKLSWFTVSGRMITLLPAVMFILFIRNILTRIQ